MGLSFHLHVEAPSQSLKGEWAHRPFVSVEIHLGWKGVWRWTGGSGVKFVGSSQSGSEHWFKPSTLGIYHSLPPKSRGQREIAPHNAQADYADLHLASPSLGRFKFLMCRQVYDTLLIFCWLCCVSCVQCEFSDRLRVSVDRQLKG